jgi:hypothetical protein
MRNRLHRRTEAHTENKIITMIAVGVRYAEISEHTGVAISTIKKIRKRNEAQFEKVEQQIVDWRASEAKKILQQTYKLLGNRLDRAEAGLEEISIMELLAISRAMFNQRESSKEMAPARSMPAQEVKEQFLKLSEALRVNDTIALVQLLSKET